MNAMEHRGSIMLKLATVIGLSGMGMLGVAGQSWFNDLVSDANTLSKLGMIGLMGFFVLLLIAALICLCKFIGKHVITQNEIQGELKQAIKQNNEVLGQVRDTIHACKGK